MTNSYPVLRRYVPQFMEAFQLRPASGTEELVRAVELLRELNKTGARKLPDDAPCGFIRPRWGRHVFTSDGLDRRFYETCVLSELGKSLRAGDLSVAGSRGIGTSMTICFPLRRTPRCDGGLAAGDRGRGRQISVAAYRTSSCRVPAGGPPRANQRTAGSLGDQGCVEDHTARQIGDYHWRKDAALRNRKLRPLRVQQTRPDSLACNF